MAALIRVTFARIVRLAAVDSTGGPASDRVREIADLAPKGWQFLLVGLNDRDAEKAASYDVTSSW